MGTYICVNEWNVMYANLFRFSGLNNGEIPWLSYIVYLLHWNATQSMRITKISVAHMTYVEFHMAAGMKNKNSNGIKSRCSEREMDCWHSIRIWVRFPEYYTIHNGSTHSRTHARTNSFFPFHWHCHELCYHQPNTTSHNHIQMLSLYILMLERTLLSHARLRIQPQHKLIALRIDYLFRYIEMWQFIHRHQQRCIVLD